MKKLFLILVIGVAAIALGACDDEGSGDQGTSITFRFAAQVNGLSPDYSLHKVYAQLSAPGGTEILYSGSTTATKSSARTVSVTVYNYSASIPIKNVADGTYDVRFFWDENDSGIYDYDPVKDISLTVPDGVAALGIEDMATWND